MKNAVPDTSTSNTFIQQGCDIYFANFLNIYRIHIRTEDTFLEAGVLKLPANNIIRNTIHH